jgi:hypothetical protein
MVVSVGQSQYHQRIKHPSVYFKGEFFFFRRANLFCKTIGKWFFFPTDMETEVGITDEGKADGRNPSVMTSVKKSLTNF